ncbi:hypothetical protein [Ferviditalea candida]|uniref:Uncharacterized protein n=1 Tax=Ferviditalea candida TaxID=3108399 RepID=A0ABU5ZI89_9BACL|nr:hypothetical protein [Paenibacillaceae bacterium T2]
MAAKKWPKWLIGISSVVSFTGFLYVAQGHQSGGNAQEISDPPTNNANSSAGGVDTIGSIPLSANTAQQNGQDGGSTIKTFVHSRAEFSEIEGLSAEAKAEREKELEQLDWDSTGGETANIPPVTVTTPASGKSAAQAPKPTTATTARKSTSVQAPKSTPKPSAAVQAPTPTPTPSAIVPTPAPAPAPVFRSDRRSRRS